MIRKFWPKWRFFKNFVHNRYFRQIWSKIEVFRKSSPKSRFSKILTKIAIFLNFGQNWDMSNILIKIDIFQSRFFKNFDQNRDFRKFGPKSGVSNKIEVFRKVCPNLKFWHRDFQTFWPKSRHYENLHQNWDFWQILKKISIFLNFGQN